MEIPIEAPSWYRRYAEVEGDEANGLFRALADERRRATLSILDRRTAPIAMAELSTLVAASERESAPDAVPDPDRDRAHIALTHVHLPILEESGLLLRTDDGRVTPDQHPFWTDSKFRRLLGDLNAPPETVTETLHVLSHPHRRTLITILDDRGACTVEELVTALLDSPLTREDSDRLFTALHHNHVPTLADCCVVEVSPDRRRLRYRGNAVLDEWWLSER